MFAPRQKICDNDGMEPSPYLLILFGSRAKDTARADSDWDVAVVGDHMLSLEERGKYAEEAARMLNTNEDRIDLADMGNASPLLQQFVAKEGKLLLGDPFLFIRFRVRAWKRYLDTAKLRRLRHESLQRYVSRIH
ncbi:MAG: nucleotidyltransferase domain-containing protein [Candidatus Sungbacteria bacterium]|nr:nucleotidyltransferase domain-containing protein [Candidatus Sungbacteria bacterium]